MAAVDPQVGAVAPGPAPALVEVRDVAVTYDTGGRQIRALKGVSLEVGAGELVGLVGPNGSGKTTLVRAITGVVKPERGTVLIGGASTDTMGQRDIALRIAVVPQDPLLPPAFSALDIVLMGRTPHLRLLQAESAPDYEIARRAMIETETWEFADRPVGELSGGERQRVVVARALAQETPVLLLDEPTAHLDIGHQVSVLDLMKSLCRDQRKAVLAVVHDLTLAAQYCDRLVMLRGGEVIAGGTPEDVLTEDLLRAVYGAAVDVIRHPVTGRPVVAPRGG